LDVTDLVRKPLTFLARLTLGALIVIDVHARDVVQLLIDDKVCVVETCTKVINLMSLYFKDE
jgi:dynein heavy chain